ncbi:hypothetical protein CK203_093800 [Vitis vinifera]|uniref:Uncharacterized protein n=1 Tax=Vitis vinifera TaxID=29760 RepID=A0A438C7T1_VITVI|nr:hypothetical protein CK203_093800 [Vitis vinifera]
MPEWIGGSLPNLFVLKLGSNGFNGGVIPRCLGSFTAMTKKESLVIAHNYSFGPFGGVQYHIGGKTPENASYVDGALVKWKRREFEYKNTLRLVKSIDLSSNKLSREFPREVIDLLD